MNDYEEGMRACFGAAKTWMAVSFTVSIFFLQRSDGEVLACAVASCYWL